MFCCLFKKVTVHNTAKLSQINCNSHTHALGIGGSDGFVKVIQIDLLKSKSEANNNNLTFTQNLVCHKKKIIVLCWNDNYDKLTTCDEEGVIIVWKLTEENKWETEMINNREVSFVSSLKWSKQGNYLCFIYDDGHAIVGTVEGSRCWGNDIRDKLYLLEWSPDASNLLFACMNYNIIVFSLSGYQIGEMEIEPMIKNIKIVSLKWWTNPFSENQTATLEKRLMIAFANGMIFLYDDYQDTKPFKIITEFNEITKAEWCPSGEIFAVSGFTNENQERKDALTFYSINGEILKTLKIPSVITSFCWDGFGTKIAITTESLILFTLVKQKYKWTYFNDTLVYSFMTETEHHSMYFWDTKKNTRNMKYVKNLIDVISYGSFCLLTAKIFENNYILILCNSIGSPVDNRIINICPEFIGLNETHVVACSKSYVYVWQYRSQHRDLSQNHFGHNINIDLLKKKFMKEIVFFVEDNPNLNDIYNADSFNPIKKSNDPISSIFVNNNWLLIACSSGRLLRYSLPHLGIADKISVGQKLIKCGLSYNGNYIWGIDENNILSLWECEKTNTTGKKLKAIKLEFQRKDVWEVIWSNEDTLKFCFMEKNRLFIIKDLEPEEPLICNGYIADFSQLEITAIMLEDLMAKPWDTSFNSSDIVIKFETRILRDLREMMANNIDINDIYTYVERNAHKKLWELFAQYSLLKLDFASAEKAMIQYNDYMGLSFIKRIKLIDDDNIKRAEIHQFFLDYEKAEETYNSIDRKDLSILMRIKLGHWEKVINLIKESGYVQEDNLKMAKNNLGIQYLENKDFIKAEEMFNETNNYEGLINVYFKSENYEKAIPLIDSIPQGSEFLNFMAEKFETYGLCEEAVKCYIKLGDVKKAIDTCVLMNKWNLAVELAEKNNFFQIEGLVTKFCNILIEKNKKMDLVELYRKAHKHTEAARMLNKIAEDLRALNASPIILKKIYVIAALEMESFKSRLIDAQITNITQHSIKQTQTLDTLITSDLSNVSDKALNNPWKGAEAFHFYMLCQSQLYEENYSAALKTSLRLMQYEKEIEAKEIYRLISLSSFLNKSFKECSKALSKLENLATLSKEDRERYHELAISIFTRIDPQNTQENLINCPGKNCTNQITEYDVDCKICGSNFSACVLTGQSLLQKDYVKCKRCKHKSLKAEALKKKTKYCPLCHVALDLSK